MVNSNPQPEGSETVVSIAAVVCALCQELPFTPGCRTCENVKAYRASSAEKEVTGQAEDDLKVTNVTFPGPAIVKRNSVYGNYVVASREIEKGELICLEKALLVSPYGPSDMLPLCLSCCKDIGLSNKDKCTLCKWAICGRDCQENSLHAENECEIFMKNGLRQKSHINEYFSIETLRCLLLRKKSPKKWDQVMRFEAHIDSRVLDAKARETREFIVDFIRNKCKLLEFDAKLIDQVVGVLSVNTFWAHRELTRYASLLFNKLTLLAHDCDPNTNRKLVQLSPKEMLESINNNNNNIDEYEEDCHARSGIRMEITAARTISPGEMITTQYLNVDQSVQVRRQELRELFYFDCSCSKCLIQLLEEDLKLKLGRNDNNNNNDCDTQTQSIDVDGMVSMSSIQIIQPCCDLNDIKSSI